MPTSASLDAGIASYKKLIKRKHVDVEVVSADSGLSDGALGKLYDECFGAEVKGCKKVVYGSESNIDVEFDNVVRIHEDDAKEEKVSKDFKKVNASWGRHGEYSLVGLEEPKPKCGMHMGYEGCLNVKGHANSLIEGHKGKVYVRLLTNHCDRPTCKVCYKYGWASRESRKAEKRLKFASKQFGQIEHIILSPASVLYSLSYEKLHKLALKALVARGIIGGAMIFHSFRYHNFREWQKLNTSDESLGWYFSPHFHVVGFLKESYNRCRNCADFLEWYSHGGNTFGCGRKCQCDGFEQTTRKCFSGSEGVKGDNFICKVEGARKTVLGTIFYQLGHSSVRLGKKRFYPLTWFGTAGYHKLCYKPEKDKPVCPICGLELVKVRYFGGVSICKDESSPNFHRHLFMDMNEGMGDVFVKAGNDDFG